MKNLSQNTSEFPTGKKFIECGFSVQHEIPCAHLTYHSDEHNQFLLRIVKRSSDSKRKVFTQVKQMDTDILAMANSITPATRFHKILYFVFELLKLVFSIFDHTYLEFLDNQFGNCVVRCIVIKDNFSTFLCRRAQHLPVWPAKNIRNMVEHVSFTGPKVKPPHGLSHWLRASPPASPPAPLSASSAKSILYSR